MRICLLFPGLFLLSSCAYEGTIVEKTSRPHPLYESVGVEEMDSFVLRDGSGATYRQMVTPEVYQRYAHGQYFNDQQIGPAPSQPGSAPDYKGTRTAMGASGAPHHVGTRPTAPAALNVAVPRTPAEVSAALSAKKKIAPETAVAHFAVHKPSAASAKSPRKNPGATVASVTRMKTPTASAPKKSVTKNTTKSLAKHSPKKSSAKVATHQAVKTKPLLKQPVVETRPENEAVANPGQ